MIGPDLRIFGAGVFGLSIGYSAALRGARVEVVDPSGVASGASGGVVGALAPHVPEGWDDIKAFQLKALLMAEGFWAGVADRAGRDPGYGRTGRLQPIADDAGLARAEARAAGAQKYWGKAAEWRLRPAAALGDWAPLAASGVLIADTLSARIAPAVACRALAAAIEALGGAVVPGPSPMPAVAVVEATGHAGLAALRDATGQPLGGGVKGQAALLQLDRAGAPQIYAGGVHIVPHADGTVAVGSTSERDFDDPSSTDGQLEAVLARAVAACPALEGAPVISRWAGVRPRARSRQPVLGADPTRPGVYLANGGFKIGFGLAPLVGEAMADLVLEGRGAAIPAAFAPATLLGSG